MRGLILNGSDSGHGRMFVVPSHVQVLSSFISSAKTKLSCSRIDSEERITLGTAADGLAILLGYFVPWLEVGLLGGINIGVDLPDPLGFAIKMECPSFGIGAVENGLPMLFKLDCNVEA